jgi:Flp pilus assembly protein TadG
MSERDRRSDRGQALVEFSLAVSVFLVLIMGIVDFGLSIYKYNGVSQAAREIARVASVYQGPTNFGVSPQLTAVVATQKHLIPGLGSPTYTCRDVNGATVALVSNRCPETAFVNVVVTAPFKAATPLLTVLGTFTMKGSSSAQIQQ